MKQKTSLKNLLIIFSLIVSVLFFGIEQIHECDGDGCLFCLFSAIIRLAANIILITTFVPIVINKIYSLIIVGFSYLREIYFTIKRKINFSNQNNYNKEVDLNRICVSLK